jgi:hypothetical protein
MAITAMRSTMKMFMPQTREDLGPVKGSHQRIPSISCRDAPGWTWTNEKPRRRRGFWSNWGLTFYALRPPPAASRDTMSRWIALIAMVTSLQRASFDLG